MNLTNTVKHSAIDVTGNINGPTNSKSDVVRVLRCHLMTDGMVLLKRFFAKISHYQRDKLFEQEGRQVSTLFGMEEKSKGRSDRACA